MTERLLMHGAALALLLAGTAPVVEAGPELFEGLIVAVGEDGRTFRAQALNCSGEGPEEALAESGFRLAPNCVVALDGRLASSAAALAPGRWFFAAGKRVELNFVTLLSERVFAPAGVVTRISEDGKGAILKTGIGRRGLLDMPVVFDEGCTFFDKGAVAEAAALVVRGARIRVTPGRSQTVRACSQAALEAAVPKGREAYEAVVTSSDGLTTAALSLRKNGVWEAVECRNRALPSPVMNARGRTVMREAYTPAQHGVYVRTPMRDNPLAGFFTGVTAEPGRVEGVLRDASADALTVSTWNGEAAYDVTVKLDPKAEVTLDGQPLAAADLTPGLSVLVLPRRTQRVDAQTAADLRAYLTIGPYLQNAGSEAVTVVWYTEDPSPGAVRYGLQPGEWAGTVADSSTGVAHVVTVSGLKPATKYYYEVLDGVAPLAGGQEYYFKTHPAAGAKTPVRFMAAGDMMGMTVAGQGWVEMLTRERPRLQFGLLLGDLAGNGGDREMYLRDFFPAYGALMRSFCLYTVLGDNDITANRMSPPCFEFFQQPTNELPKTAGLYSFDYANVHFICLGINGIGTEPSLFETNRVDKVRATEWISRDLADARQRGQDWFIALAHVSPYGGKDGTDANTLSLLEQNGVDVMLGGHTHAATRTHLVVNATIAEQNGESLYTKTKGQTGTIYLSVGTGGLANPLRYGASPLLTFRLGSTNGMEIIETDGDTLTGTFMGLDGQALDMFRLRKTLRTKQIGDTQ